MPHRRPPSARAVLLALAPLAPLVALACDAAPTPPELRSTLDAGDRVAMTWLRGEPSPLTFGSGLREPARSVVRDDALWAATWTAIWSRHDPQPALPPVDFDREMVVVAALGERSSGAHAILLDSATVHGGTLVVHLRTIAPGPRCFVTAALTQAVDAARLARHDGPVEFRERAEVRDCD